jgi:hypothetical protein
MEASGAGPGRSSGRPRPTVLPTSAFSARVRHQRERSGSLHSPCVSPLPHSCRTLRWCRTKEQDRQPRGPDGPALVAGESKLMQRRHSKSSVLAGSESGYSDSSPLISCPPGIRAPSTGCDSRPLVSWAPAGNRLSTTTSYRRPRHTGLRRRQLVRAHNVRHSPGVGAPLLSWLRHWQVPSAAGASADAPGDA